MLIQRFRIGLYLVRQEFHILELGSLHRWGQGACQGEAAQAEQTNRCIPVHQPDKRSENLQAMIERSDLSSA